MNIFQKLLLKFSKNNSAFFKIVRDKYTLTETTGRVFINNSHFGYSLEDVVRADGIKIKKHTAIEAGCYEIEVRKNSSGIDKIYVNDVVLFQYIQCHGGNDHKDTDGCPLIAKNRYDKTIQGSLEKDMIKLVKSAKYSYLEIINLNQLDP